MTSKLPERLKSIYPFKSNYFKSNAGGLNYVDEGDGPAVVMIHGNPTWSFLYRDLIKQLSPFYRCLALDHLGCGLSDKPTEESLYDLDQHIDRVVAWIESLDINHFVLIVHDWGGPIGLGAAAKLKDKVKGLIITNTAAFPFKRIPLRISLCRFPVLGPLAVQGLNAFVRAAKSMTTVNPLSSLEKFGYSFPYDCWSNRIAIRRFVEDIPMTKSHPSFSTLKEIEGSLANWEKTPVSIHWGMQDWCFHPILIPEWEKRLPHAKVNRYEKAGHYLFEDDFEAISKRIKADLSNCWSL